MAFPFTTVEAIESMSAGDAYYWLAWLFWASGMDDESDGDYLSTFIDIEFNPDAETGYPQCDYVTGEFYYEEDEALAK